MNDISFSSVNPVSLVSLYNPQMKNGAPRGNENDCGYRYPHTLEEAEADLRYKTLFFAAMTHLTGGSFALTVDHILDLRPVYFTVEKGRERDWSDPIAPHEIPRLAEPEIRYRYARTNHFGTDSLARKSGGQEGVPVYRRDARMADSKKRRADIEDLLAPYDPAIREEERFSPRVEEERFETPRFLRPPLKTVRGWVSAYTLQTARIRIDSSFADKLLSGRDKFWIKSMERHTFLDTVAGEMAGALLHHPEKENRRTDGRPVRLILTDEGVGFGEYLADENGSVAVLYDPKSRVPDSSKSREVPWAFKAYGMSSLPEPKLRMFLLASLLSRILPLTSEHGGPGWYISAVDLSRRLAGSRKAAEIDLLPAE